jgi:hypothetical protein
VLPSEKSSKEVVSPIPRQHLLKTASVCSAELLEQKSVCHAAAVFDNILTWSTNAELSSNFCIRERELNVIVGIRIALPFLPATTNILLIFRASVLPCMRRCILSNTMTANRTTNVELWQMKYLLMQQVTQVFAFLPPSGIVKSSLKPKMYGVNCPLSDSMNISRNTASPSKTQ